MRIIAGEFKKRNLYSVPGNTARPTTDFNRECLFDIIESCHDKSFLDLFAGSGAVGLEALSRGASRCVFVEFSLSSLHTIQQNIEHLGCSSRCQIFRRKVSSYLMKTEESFDLIFMDPPYDKGLVQQTLQLLADSKAVKKDTVIIIEHSTYEQIPPEWVDKIINTRSTRQTQLTFLRR
jgi:16S rRNA (guanine966-N2)-methyltransferase